MTAREVAELRDRVARLKLEQQRQEAGESLALVAAQVHSLWGYKRYRCRCSVCRAANRDHKARWRASLRARKAVAA